MSYIDLKLKDISLFFYLILIISIFKIVKITNSIIIVKA